MCISGQFSKLVNKINVWFGCPLSRKKEVLCAFKLLESNLCVVFLETPPRTPFPQFIPNAERSLVSLDVDEAIAKMS